MRAVLPRLTFLALSLLILLMPNLAGAACSSWRGKVFLNEYYAAVGTSTQFIELYSANGTFATSTWQGWKVDVWKKSGGSATKTTYNLGTSATNYECRSGGKTWVTRELTGSEDLEKNTGMVILRDGSGKPVDVLVFDNTLPTSGPAPWPATNGTGGYYPSLQTECSNLGNALNSQRTAAIGATKPYNAFNMTIYQANANKNYSRTPDGSGNWGSSNDTGAGSTKTTCSSNNTTIVKTTSTPIVSPGDTASWTVSLTNPDAAVTNVIVTDVLKRFTGDITGTQTSPSGITSVTATPSASCGTVTSAYNSTTGSLTWTIPSLGNLATCTLTMSAVVPSTIPENEILQNNASTSIAGVVLSDAAEVTVKRKVAVDLRLDDATATSGTQTFKDSSGAARDGIAVGGTTMASSGKVCRGATVPSNTSAAVIDAIDTNYSIPSGIGGYGGITFWYKNNQAWSGSGAQMLFDASNGTTAPFYLIKNNDGSLTFRVSDTTPTTYTVSTAAQTTAAGVWVHIAAIWQVIDGSKPYLAIYLNGSLVASSTAAAIGTDINSTLATLYIGDTRTTTTPTGGTGNSANGGFDMIKLFSGNVTATDVSTAAAALNPCLSKAANSTTYAQGSTGSWAVTLGNAGSTSSAIVVTDTITPIASYDLTSITATPSSGCGSASIASNVITWTVPTGLASNATCTLALSGAIPAAATVNGTYTNGVTATINNAPQSANASFTVTAASSSGFEAAECVTSLNGTTGTNGSISDCTVSSVRTPKTASVANSGYNDLYLKLAGVPFNLDVLALDAVSANGLATFAGTLDVDLVTGSGTGTNNCYATETSTRTVRLKTGLQFAAGRATLPATTPSAAYSEARLKFSNCSGTGCPTGGPWCSTSRFAIRPQAFAIAPSGGPGTTATQSTSFATTFAAGSAFTLNVTSAAGYTNTIGSETIAAVTGLTDASGGTLSGGDITWNATSPTATGAGTVSAIYENVGFFLLGTDWLTDSVFTSASQPGNCVSSSSSNTRDATGKYGCTIGSTATTYIGRFKPAYFDIVATPSCPSSFVFSRQPFKVNITAKSALGTTLTNYASGSYAKAVTISDANAVAGGSFTTSSIAASNFTAGVADVTNSTLQPVYRFTTEPQNPVSILVRATESAGGDGVTSNVSSTTYASHVAESAIEVRSGRLRLSNNYGSEKLALDLISGQIQARVGGVWVDDTNSCTTLPLPTTGNGGLLATCSGALASGAVTAYSGITTPSTVQSASGLMSGVQIGNLSGGAVKGPGTAGCVTVDLDAITAWPAWLPTSQPSAIYSFGLYNQLGNAKKIIYRREVRRPSGGRTACP